MGDPVRLFVAIERTPDHQRDHSCDPHRSWFGSTLRGNQEASRRQRLGNRPRDAILVMASLCLLLCAGLLLLLVPVGVGSSYRNHPREFDPTVDGMSDRAQDDRGRAATVLRLECGELWQ